MPDRISQYRTARLSLFLPHRDGGNVRYALLVNTVIRGVPSGQIVVDGTLPSAPARPTTEELLELFDSAIRQHMLGR